MRTKVTIILLLLNAALFYYIFYVRDDDGQRLVDTTVILGSEASNIQALTIENRDSNTIPAFKVTLARRGENWFVTSPVEWPANPSAVRRIISDLQFLRSEASFTVQALAQNGQTLADYGLENPKLILIFTPAAPASAAAAAPAPITLKIGDATKVGNRLYILSPDGQRVHVVSRSLAESLEIKLDTLRSTTLFSIAVYEARSLNIEPDPGTRIRFRRDNDRWSLEAPIQARANKTRTENTINSLDMLSVSRFLDTPPAVAAAQAALATPLRVSIEGNNRSESLLIGAPLADAKAPAPNTADDIGAAREYYAQLDNKKTDQATPFTVVIPDRLMNDLRDAQQRLRERRILDIDSNTIITGITISAPPQTEVVLQSLETAGAPNRANIPWQIVRRTNDQGPQTTPADHDAIQRLITNLARLAAVGDNPKSAEKGFVNDAPSDAEKENYGFTTRPAREITLTFAPPAAPAPGAIATPPPAVTLQIGLGADRKTYARLTNQNYIYRVSPAILDDTPVDPLAYRDRVLRELSAGAQVTALKLTERDTGKVLLDTTLPLALDTQPPDRHAAIETIAAQFRTLRAKNYVAEEFSKDEVNVAGDKRPWKYLLEATITLSGGTAPQTTQSELYIADRTGGMTQYIGAPQYNVVFEAEQPLIDALHTLTYGPRDPGPPPPQPAAQPAPAP